MGNEERMNIVPTILLESLRSSLPNELFKLNEEEDSEGKREKERQRKEERNFKWGWNERSEKKIQINKKKNTYTQYMLYFLNCRLIIY